MKNWQTKLLSNNTFSHRPLVYLVIAYIIGILINFFMPFKPQLSLILVILSFLLATVLIIASKKGVGLAFLGLFIALGMLLTSLQISNSKEDYEPFIDHFVRIEGVICAEPELKLESTSYILKVDKIIFGDKIYNLSGKILVQADKGLEIVSYGQGVKIKGFLRMPREAGNPGQFDYGDYLLRHGILGIVYLNNEEDLKVVSLKGGNPIVKLCLNFKEKLISVSNKTLPHDLAILFNGMAFGVTGQFTDDLRQEFSEAGVSHLLSVSGLHVGFILVLALFFFRFLRLKGLALLFSLCLVLIFYALMTGINPPVVRATVMAIILLLANHFNRETDWATTLAFAMFLILFFSPLTLFNIGFQLSFIATGSILYFAKLVKGFLPLPEKIAYAVSVPLVSQVATIPLTAYYFNIISLGGVLSNILLVPLSGIIIPLGLIATLLGQFFLPLAQLIQISTQVLLEIFKAGVVFFRNIPGAYFYTVSPTYLWILLWFVALYSHGRYLNKIHKINIKNLKSAKTKLLWLSFPLLLLVLIFSPQFGKDNLVIQCLDVGQGDSILIQFPNGKNMLIDAGGKCGEFLDTNSGAGTQVLSYLKKLGINKLDAALITHPHEDHAGGMVKVLEYIKTDYLFVTPLDLENQEVDPAYIKLLEDVVKKNIPLKELREGYSLKIDEKVEILILNPPKSKLFKGTRSDLNNNSVALLITYKDQKIFLGADIEEEAQEAILNKIPSSCSIYKVSHHGSAYQSEKFIKRLNPKIALISCGKDNNFGHPADSLIDELYNLEALIYRTDLDGAIILTLDGNKTKISSKFK